MLFHMTDLLKRKELDKLAIAEDSYEEDLLKAERLHLTTLARRFTLRQSILGQKSATLSQLLRGLTLFSGIENMMVQLPLAYFGTFPCLRAHWTQVCCPSGRFSICFPASFSILSSMHLEILAGGTFLQM